MGCTKSKERSPALAEAEQELLEYLATAKACLARGEAVIPCEHTGTLHSNWTGQCRGFCSPEAMRRHYAAQTKVIRDVKGSILKHWHELDADFTLQNCSLAGASLPPYRKLQPRVRARLGQQAAAYQRVYQTLPEEDRNALARFEALWPCESPERLKELSRQPEEATTMRLTYAVGLAALEPLFRFSVGLARLAGSTRPVQYSVKRPLRLLRKTLLRAPEEFAKNNFRHCCDVYRTSVIVDSLRQVGRVLELLRQLGRDAQDRQAVLGKLGLAGTFAEFVVERIKNRFAEPCAGGYMDVLVALRVDGYVCEMQLQLQRLAEVRGEAGRALHKWARPFEREASAVPLAGAAGAQQGAGGGTLLAPCGGRYRGELKSGQRHGRGTFFYANGDRYEGEFVEGKKHGEGAYFYASGDSYRGGFRGDTMDGVGTYSCANGDRFEGSYIAGKRHGDGAFHYRNGSCLRGDWWRNQHVLVVSV